MKTNNPIPPPQPRPLALLLLVLTFILAGCDNDDCDFTPPPASLTVTITAYSLEDGSVLHTRQEAFAAETDDGALPAQEKTYASPEVKGFLAADDQTVQLPAVSPGQQLHFSVSFFLPSVYSIVEKSESKVTGSTIVSTETDEVIDFTFVPGSSEEIEVPFKMQCRITNMEEVKKYIEGLFPQTRKDFSDDSKISYKEVTDVVSTVIEDGFNSGDFAPSCTLKRGAAAKKISVILPPITADSTILKHLMIVEEMNKPNQGEEENPNISLAVEIDRKYITANETYNHTVVIQGKSYTVENIKVEVVRTEITITYLNTGSSGQIGNWKPVTGQGVAD